MNPPYVSAIVQVRPPVKGGRGAIWMAAIVLAVHPERKQLTSGGWIEAVDLGVFYPNGGILPARMVGRLREAADETDNPEEYVWRWAPESRR